MQNTAQTYKVGDRISARVLYKSTEYTDYKLPDLHDWEVSQIDVKGNIVEIEHSDGNSYNVSPDGRYYLTHLEKLPNKATRENPLSHLSYTDLNSIRNKAYILGHKALYDEVDSELNKRYNNLNQFYVQS